MDIISHGLWGGVATGRRSRKSYWLAFLFGIAPDLFSFGLFTPLAVLGFVHGIDWQNGPPPESSIPNFVHVLYNITHSFVIFALVFLIVWMIFKKPIYEMLAWGLHIAMDIFSHSSAFFPTPFLWPISDFHVNGIPWSHPIIFIPDLILLAVLYLWWYFSRRKVIK